MSLFRTRRRASAASPAARASDVRMLRSCSAAPDAAPASDCTPTEIRASPASTARCTNLKQSEMKISH